jgi:hypothetical protein
MSNTNSLTVPEGYVRHTTSSTELDIIGEYGCLNQPNILSFRRIFLLLLRNFFSNSKNFNVSYSPDWVENFDHYTYSDPFVDPNNEIEDTIDIVLSYQYADNISKMEYLKEGQKPQLIINIGDFDYQAYGVVDDLTNTTKTFDGSTITGQNTICNITISAYGRTYADSTILSQLASSFLIGMRPVLINKLKLKDFKPIKLTAPVCINAEEATKTFKSDFILQLTFESNYRSKQECLILKTSNIEKINIKDI